MFHAESNKTAGVLTMNFAQDVNVEEMKCCLERVRCLVEEIEPGFRIITDLSGLNSMDPECATHLGAIMELCDQKGVKAIFRVVPDPQKDIGFALLSHFHYGPAVKLTTYETLADAISGIST